MNESEIATRPRLYLALGALVLAGLFSILFGFLCDVVFGHDVWTDFVLANFALVVGLPMAAALAFAIVVAFQQTSDEPLTIKFGPLEISGPAGPILLWVACYLATVLAISIVK